MLKRNALQRLKKYEAKLDPEIIKIRLEKEREAMSGHKIRLLFSLRKRIMAPPKEIWWQNPPARD